jgi:hypothetical protein
MGHRGHWQQRIERDGAQPVEPKNVRATPVEIHKLRKRGVQVPAVVGTPARPTGHAATHRYTQPHEQDFAAEVESLHGLSIKEKVARKKDLVEIYRPQVEALLDAGQRRVQLWTWWIVWLFDVGRVDEFIAQAERAIALDWLTEFSSDLRTFRFDKIMEWAKGEFEHGRGVEPYFGKMHAKHADMLEVVAAKYHKLAGDMWARQAENAGSPAKERAALDLAVQWWTVAEIAYDKAGVKTRIDKAKKRLAQLGAGSPSTPSKTAPKSKPKPKAKPAAKAKKSTGKK